MMDAMQTPMSWPLPLWQVITHVGSASLILPVMMLTAGGLCLCRQRKMAVVWLGTLALAAAICLASKVAFIGWGIGIALINFTGVSGHALLAMAVLPVVFYWLLAWQTERHGRFGMAVGGLLGLAVAVSRVVLGAHSVSEVIVGSLLGMVVSGLTIHAARCPLRHSRLTLAAPAMLLFAFNPAASSYLPTHSCEVTLALRLAGHDRPYVRADLLRGSRQPGHE